VALGSEGVVASGFDGLTLITVVSKGENTDLKTIPALAVAPLLLCSTSVLGGGCTVRSSSMETLP
jgi:hypothetical protein